MYPSRSQYKAAVLNEMFPSEQNGGYSFTPVLDNNEPLISSGGNATVFKVADSNSNEYALKLFSDEISGRFNRLTAISKFLETTSFSFFTHFKFIQKLIYVEILGQPDDACYFPGVVLNWVNGQSLDIILATLTKNKKTKELKKIADNFKKISLSLLENGITHGDLKLSNILVNDNLELFLIDYDGMYLPELKGQSAIENGTPSYQHPKRTENHFDESIDHFSILNIYLSLLVLSDKPDLFVKYNDGDNIIFTKEDFDNPDNSNLFKEIEDEKIQIQLLYYLKKSLNNDSIQIDNIADLINGKYPTPRINITHSPQDLVLGQDFIIKWETFDTDFLLIDGENQSLSGQIQLVSTIKQELLFSYGTSINKLSYNYSIKTSNPPKILGLKASNTDLKYDEPLVLSWKVENTKKVMLCYDVNQIDVTNQNQYSIVKLEKDTVIQFVLESEFGDFKKVEELSIKVYYPITLDVRQERNITYINRPVKIFIKADNAEEVLLKPGNIDLLGKETYEIRTDDHLKYQIIASNKRYISTFESYIDVLKPPSYDRKIIRLPEFKINLPAIPARYSVMDEYYINKKSFHKKSSNINKFLDRFNIFKIDFKRGKNE